MNELINILANFTLEDAIKSEEGDRQYLAIKRLVLGIKNKSYIFPLVICNSLVCYQLSSSGEEYWEEFSSFAINFDFGEGYSFEKLYNFFEIFLPQSKGNKRILNMKILRLLKTEKLLERSNGNELYFYENLLELQKQLIIFMKQKEDSKTVLFALKMFHYTGREVFGFFKVAPFEIGIPVDSRITKIENIYNSSNINHQIFWGKISKEIGIPCLHLDAIIWTKCNDFLCFRE